MISFGEHLVIVEGSTDVIQIYRSLYSFECIELSNYALLISCYIYWLSIILQARALARLALLDDGPQQSSGAVPLEPNLLEVDTLLIIIRGKEFQSVVFSL